MLDTMAGALNNNNKLYLNCKINLITNYSQYSLYHMQCWERALGTLKKLGNIET